MSPHLIGLIIGGVLPAFCFGISAIFVKLSNSAGISLGYYMILLGLAVILTGSLCLFLLPDRTISFAAGRDAFLAGLTWSGGAALLAFAVAKYKAPIAQLVPLYNMNTLIGVLFGLWIFSEWQELNVSKLIVGAIFVLVGGTLVALA